MTQTLWITQGPFREQWITMKNADADDARTHHFGFLRTPDWTVSDDLASTARNSFVAADQAFLAAWLGRLGAASYNPRETGAANVGPTAIAINPSTIQRDRLVGTVVGTLTATDADQTGGHIFTSADTNFSIGGINGDQVLVAKRPGPVPSAYPMTITATDTGGLSFTGPVTITITA